MSRWHLLLKSSRSCREEGEKGLWVLARVRVNQVAISLDGTFSFKKVYGTQTSIYKEKKGIRGNEVFLLTRLQYQTGMPLATSNRTTNKQIKKQLNGG